MTRLATGFVVLLLTGAVVTFGQTFEAASVKAHDSASPGRSGAQGGPGASDLTRFLCRNCSHADKDGFPDPAPGSGIHILADVQNTYRLGAKNVSMQRFADG